MKDLEPITREEFFLADVIEAIESGGGGGDLPAVTSDDNGDVLTVVEGAWAKAAPSASVIKFTVVDGNETLITPYADILEMFNNGVMPTVAKINNDGIVSLYKCTLFEKQAVSNSFNIEASYSSYTSGEEANVSTSVIYIAVAPDETSTITYGSYYFSVTDDD